MKRKIIITVMLLIIAIGSYGAYIFLEGNEGSKVETKTDGERFAEDYTLLNKENVFVYRTAEEIVKILENGTGVVYLGFDECRWCQQYVVYLNEVAQDVGVEKIYYLDILEDRTSNTKEYQQIVELLSDNLGFDNEGNPRVAVPDVSIIKKGEIIGHDNETAWISDSELKTTDYWTEERVLKLKEKLIEMLSQVSDKACSECNQ